MVLTWVDNCKFTPTAGGTTDWTYSSAASGYQSPAAAGITNGATYNYFAITTDLTQWELGKGAYNTGTGVLARTTVLYNSSGTGTATGQSGAGTKINFTTVPAVALVALAEDLLVSTTLNQFEYSATAGQTTFSGADQNGATLAYTVGFIQVFVNGFKVNKADYTATDGTSVVIGSAAALGDLITIVAFSVQSVANALVPANNLNDVASASAARSNLGAASFEAMASNNIAINGGMEVSQENGTTQVTLVSAAAKYVVDQWWCSYVHAAATAVFKSQQITPANSPAFGLGFPSCLQLIATTASAMAGAGDYALLSQPIEGTRISKLGFGSATNPQSFTIGFWVCATVTGTATLTVRNSALNRTYLADFTVNAANTWEYKTVTIPVDTTGTWLATTGVGMNLGFCFGSGSTFQGTNTAWQAGNFLKTASTTNFFASNNNAVNITGVGVWAGTDAPTAARSPLAQRPFPEEVQLCRRYWETVGLTAVIVSPPYNNTSWYRAQKRVSPTITLIGGAANSTTVGVVTFSPLDGMRQIGSASGAVDQSYSIDARM
jgi:hypothetical protein